MKTLRTSLLASLCLLLLAGFLYPLIVWGVSQLLFAKEANGSLTVVGSELLARDVTDARYFHPRPSAVNYDATHSGGSNLAWTSPKLIDSVRARTAAYRSENDLPEDAPIPPDAITASGSGLDPHISLQNATLQAGRIARARGISKEAVLALIDTHKEGGLFSDPRINVQRLNLALDKPSAQKL